MSWFPVVLILHVCLAVALLAPSLLLPFLLRREDASKTVRNPLTRALMAMQGTGTLVIGIGLAITGTLLIVLLGIDTLSQPWLLVALVIYAANLLVAGLVSRPNLRRLLRLGSGPSDDEAWRRRARRQRWVAYGMAAATGVIGFLMMAKPGQ
ncbi:MAG TPA: DUF2269 family protein [Candidatus Limnocylindria bacterium]|nr:DUF2269 family protein [Candidatus Limnocylindria bacterium]